MVGWLVFVLKRHAEALHDLSRDEFMELADLQYRTAQILHAETGCLKEYSACFAEAPGFAHVHVHMVARPPALPDALRGPAIFALIQRDAPDALLPEAIIAFCAMLRAQFAA